MIGRRSFQRIHSSTIDRSATRVYIAPALRKAEPRLLSLPEKAWLGTVHTYRVLLPIKMAHSHCESCILAHCRSTVNNCPVEPCPNGCEIFLHRCKTEEHIRYTCPTSAVPCINACYGCEAVLPRTKLARHLNHCPASVVQCRFSYDRPAIDNPSARSTHCDSEHENELLLDEKCLLADVSLAQQVGKCIQVGQGRHGGEKSTLQFDIECYTGSDLMNPNSKSIISSIKSLVPRSRVCIDTTVTTYNYYSSSSLGNLSHTKRYACFPCNEIVRRDEFSTHWEDCHIGVQTNMCSIIERCPMREYGCKYRAVRMAPNPSGASLDYMQEADCIAMKLPQHVTDGPGKETVRGVYAQQIQKRQELACYGYGEDESYDVLSQLPAEILMKICYALDSLSLWNLSQVNHYIRNVCFYLVKKRGIVYWIWRRKEDSKRWEQGKTVRTHILHDNSWQ